MFTPEQPSPDWIVVSDFDGTFTVKDIGNELCLEVYGEKFLEIHQRFRREEIDLKSMQKILWETFPLSEKKFRERSLFFGNLRPGVNEFLERCADEGIPVYVASCGLRPYIEPVLDEKLSPKARAAVLELRCNDAAFGENAINRFTPPDSADDCPYPLDKGAWSSELKKKYGPMTRVLGIGNGTSDRSFIGHVDRLAATEGLATWCKKSGVAYEPFENFFDIQLPR